MVLYSDYPAARTRQIIADVIAVVVAVLVITIAASVAAAIRALGGFGAGTGIPFRLTDLRDARGNSDFDVARVHTGCPVVIGLICGRSRTVQPCSGAS